MSRKDWGGPHPPRKKGGMLCLRGPEGTVHAGGGQPPLAPAHLELVGDRGAPYGRRQLLRPHRLLGQEQLRKLVIHLASPFGFRSVHFNIKAACVVLAQPRRDWAGSGAPGPQLTDGSCPPPLLSPPRTSDTRSMSSARFASTSAVRSSGTGPSSIWGQRGRGGGQERGRRVGGGHRSGVEGWRPVVGTDAPPGPASQPTPAFHRKAGPAHGSPPPLLNQVRACCSSPCPPPAHLQALLAPEPVGPEAHQVHHALVELLKANGHLAICFVLLLGFDSLCLLLELLIFVCYLLFAVCCLAGLGCVARRA